MKYWIAIQIFCLLWRSISSSVGDPRDELSTIFKHKSSEQLSHTSVYCKNVTASIEFFSLFGFKFINRRPDMGFPGAYMTFPNSQTNELHLISIGDKNLSESVATDPDSISLYGRSHIAVSIHSGMENVIESCRKLNMNILMSAPRPGDLRSSLFIESPDGNVVEVSQAASEWIAEKTKVEALADKAYKMLKELNKQGNKVYSMSVFNSSMISRTKNTAEKTAAVAFGNPIAADIALKMLKAGGSAVDAAIAGNIAMCVLEPMNAGLGGDLFAMVVGPEEDDAVWGLNGSGSVPGAYDTQGAIASSKVKGSLPLQGTLTTNTIPGTVAGWFAMHTKYGKLPWTSLFTEGIQLAMHGFTVSSHTRQNWNHLLRFIEAYRSGLLSLTAFSDFMSIYSSGYVGPLAGEKYRNPALGRTLMRISNYGSADFYTGLLSQELGKHLHTAGVGITQSDFASSYHRNNGVEWVKPLSSMYRNRYEVLAFPDNSQGIAALQILKILEGFDPRRLSADPVMRIYCHLAAKRVVYIHDRAVLGGDTTKTMGGHIAGLSYTNISLWILKSFTQGQPFNPYELVQLKPSVQRELSLPVPPDTVGYVVRDGSGMMVTGLQSIGGAFGSGIASPHHGFVMQNRGSGFAVKESMSSHPNALKAGRRPFHTLCPWVVRKKGKVLAALAVKGGDKQPYAFTQIMVNLIDRRMSVADAVSDPRFRHVTTIDPTPSNAGNIRFGADNVQVVEVEANFVLLDSQVAELLKLGIKITRQVESNGKFEDSGFGIAQVIIVGRNSGSRLDVIAVTDGTRKPGKAEVTTLS